MRERGSEREAARSPDPESAESLRQDHPEHRPRIRGKHRRRSGIGRRHRHSGVIDNFNFNWMS